MVSFFTLDGKGIAAAVVFGALIYVFGGQTMGAFFLLVILWFLLLSGIVTWIGKNRKRAIGVYQRSRSWSNVVANGIVPVFVAIFYHFNLAAGIIPSYFIVVSYVASVAAITADKFSSELGVLGGRPYMLMTGRKVKQGTSGGITAFGFGAGLLGSLLIAIAFLGNSSYPVYLLVVLCAGFLGNVVDSILGYFEEKEIGNKFTSNFACSFAGWGVSLLLLLLV
ncbi:MAG: DUF92 domain-containing protein [Candidatus Micrarchaeota archaeon]|nr:DUF92 domain-containing protein [Candidatus Micrarchaeota archaeon]MDE1864451.1 DUF92 domain-containing protein [Candidatus Micrarchaeota archaeon]